jgi:hypothetical protein
MFGPSRIIKVHIMEVDITVDLYQSLAAMEGH